MNDKNKIKMESVYSEISKSIVLNDLVESADNSSDEIYVKKGFPLGLKVFWGIIAFLFVFRIVSFLWFDLPFYRIFEKQYLAIKILEQNKQYEDALRIHETLMEQYSAYEEYHYLQIACCYFSCSEIKDNMRKGLELLKTKELSEKQFIQLKNSVAASFKELFPMMFSIYEKQNKDKSKVYVLNPENIGL